MYVLKMKMKMCKPWTLQILIILHCLFHEYPVQSFQSVEDIEPQEEVVVPVVASQSTLPEEAWSKWIRFLLSGVGWGQNWNTWWFGDFMSEVKVADLSPKKHVRKQTIRHRWYQAASKLVSRESTTLEVATWWPFWQVKDLSMLHWKSHWKASQLGCPKLGGLWAHWPQKWWLLAVSVQFTCFTFHVPVGNQTLQVSVKYFTIQFHQKFHGNCGNIRLF